MSLRALRQFPLLKAAELNPATSSSLFTLQISASREWSRRAIAHSQVRISAQNAHRITPGKKSIESGSSIPTNDLSRYILYLAFYLIFQILNSNQCRMADATSISCNTLRDAKTNGNSTTCLASNEKAAVLSGEQKQEQEKCCVHVSERIYYQDETAPDDSYFDPVLNDHEHLYFDPVLDNYEPTRIDLFSREPRVKDNLGKLSSKDLSSCLTTVNIDEAFPLRSLSVLPIPTSPSALYHNLLHILRARTSRPSLAALLDYHLLFPDHQSVKSYNLLIFLSIHHRAYGITRKLFRTMQARSFERNIETHRLYVSWFILRGFWNRAWIYATHLTNKSSGDRSLLPIWLEFCHTRRTGPIINGSFNPKTKKELFRDVSEPVSLISARSCVMNTKRPPSIPALKDTPPGGLRNLVQMMVNSRLKHQALKLTEDYFRTLPPKIEWRVNHRCLDIVKIHLVSNGKGKTGRPRFNAAKTLFFSLLSLNPSLRPTSDTLMFILSILKDARHSGTIAWKFISLCKEKWGADVEDRRIRRRVSRLALKEGRMDIVRTLLRAETIERRSRRQHSLELKVVGDSVRPSAKFLHRPSVHRIYPRNGRETYMWRCLRIRFHMTLKKRKAQGRQFSRGAEFLARERALMREATKSIR